MMMTTLFVLLALAAPAVILAGSAPASSNEVLSSTLEASRATAVVTTNDLGDEEEDEEDEVSNLPVPGSSSSSSNNSSVNSNKNKDLDLEDANDTSADEDKNSKRKRRNKRCKCLKRYLKEVQQMMDERFEDFESRYQVHLTGDKDRALTLQNEASSMAARVQSMDRMLLKLNSDVQSTRETLAMMTSNLDGLRHEMNHTKGDVRFLNFSVEAMDLAVGNLSRFVSRLERMIPQGLSTRPEDGPQDLAVDEPPRQSYPRNCDEVHQQGGMQFQGDYYIMIKPDGVARPFRALCKVFNNSGWTVIQKREDGSVDFFRSWQEYKKGFGSLEGEFWLGNDYIHHLSTQEPTVLRIEMKDWEGKEYYAVYDSFRIDNEKGLYRLNIGTYSGDAGDSLRSHWENHDGMPFSTKDKDNDGRYYDSCAEHFHGAWWFNNCFDSHLNGKYYHKGFHKNYFQRDGIQWNTIHMYSSLKSVSMMIKPKQDAVPLTTVDPNKAKAVGKKRKGRSKGKQPAERKRE